MTEVILFVLMFLLCYAPKIGPYLDSLSFVSVIVFLVALLSHSLRHLRQTARKQTKFFFVCFLFMAIYTFFLVTINGLADMYQPLRFSRCAVNVLGAAGLVSLYYQTLKNRAPYVIIKHAWLCVIAHAFLMVLMFFVEPLNIFVVDYIRRVDPESKIYDIFIQGKRISGLTASLDATSGMQTLGVLYLPLAFSRYRKVKARMAFVGSVFLSLLSMALAGATGFILLPLGLILLTLIRRGEEKKYKLLLLMFFIVIALSVFYFSHFGSVKLKGYSIVRTYNMYFSDYNKDRDSYSQSQHTLPMVLKTISNMYFLPDDLRILVFGAGGSGRNRVEYYIAADPGIVLNIHNIGLFATLFLYGIIIYEIRRAIRVCKSQQASYYYSAFVFITCVIVLAIDFKVSYLFARNSTTFMMLALIVFWQHLDETKHFSEKVKTSVHWVGVHGRRW